MADSATVREFTSDRFDSEVLKSELPVFIDFWAPWCGPCRIVGPVIEDLAPGYEGKLTVGKLNVDEHPAVAQQYQVTSIPTMIIFRNGQPVDRAIGAMPRSELQKFMDRNL
ncbi:MAG TPA: thioredoxin [Thermoanaerobaculia bacterium]|nr:thioredoxin [Thermoanaerobaculia bacterium]